MANQIVTEKFCPGCNTLKTTDLFYVSQAKVDGLQPKCKECQKKRGSTKGARTTQNAWRRRNKARLQHQLRTGLRGERRREYERRYYRLNETLLRKRASTYYHADVLKSRRYRKEWCSRNFGNHKAHQCNGYGRQWGASGIVSPTQIEHKFAYHGWKCYLCGKVLDKQCVAEHRKPLSRGGTNWIANIAPACGPCNNSKASRTEAGYRIFLARKTNSAPFGIVRGHTVTPRL